MRIELQIEGGFVYMPGLQRPRILDSRELSAQEAKQMQKLVQAANFFELPATQDQDPQGADHRTYKITAKDETRNHAIQVSDPIRDPQLQALLIFVQQHASV